MDKKELTLKGTGLVEYSLSSIRLFVRQGKFKKCSKCGIYKQLEGSDAVMTKKHPYCNFCRSVYFRNRYLNDPVFRAKQIERSKQYYQLLKTKKQID